MIKTKVAFWKAGIFSQSEVLENF